MTVQTASASTCRRGTPIGWVISFLLFPYGPFIYLAYLGALSPLRLLVFLVASAILHIGMVSVLIQINGVAWQDWLVLLLGLGNYCLGMFQFTAGKNHGLWSPSGDRLWRFFGWTVGILLLLGVLTQVLVFHLARKN